MTEKRVSGIDLVKRNRWKEIRSLWGLLHLPELNKISIENSMCNHGDTNISIEHFMVIIIGQFGFDGAKSIEKPLRKIHASFGIDGFSDWRHVFASLQILTYFRLIKLKPEELLCQNFDLFSREAKDSNDRNEWFIDSNSHLFCNLFLVPTLSVNDELRMKDLLNKLFSSSLADYLHHSSSSQRKDSLNIRVSKQLFRQLLGNHLEITQLWSEMAWKCLPSELRLEYLKEEEDRLIQSSNNISDQYCINLAKYFHLKKQLRNGVIKLQKLKDRSSTIKYHIGKQYYKKSKSLFQFWKYFTKEKIMLRRKNLLARMIGFHKILFRYFYELKLWVINNKKIRRVVGYCDKYAKRVAQGMSHLRDFNRIYRLRIAYETWWEVCIVSARQLIAEHHCYKRRLRQIFYAWKKWLETEVSGRHRDAIIDANKEQFHKIMEETDQAIEEIVNIEKKRNEHLRKQEEEMFKFQREKKLREASERAKTLKDEENRVILAQQRINRQQRVENQLLTLKKKFTKKYKKIRTEMLEKTKITTKEFIGEKLNKLAMETKFKRFKAEFYAPPTPESQEKEKKLTSFKNIVFAHLDVKLKTARIKIAKEIARFDKDAKGYLTYDEFKDLVATFKFKFTEIQLSEMLRAADEDGDGYIDVEEIQHGLEQSRTLYAPGSQWIMYVDPIQDVMCYQNIYKGEKIFEYNMNDTILREIFIETLYGAAAVDTEVKFKELKRTKWIEVLRDYYATKIQSMFHQRKAYKLLRYELQKKHRAYERLKRSKTQYLNNVVCKLMLGVKARDRFRKQLHLTYEKIWDVEQKCLFWLNHLTKESSWNKPKLLIRYGDVTSPTPWIPIDSTPEPSDDFSLSSTDLSSSYVHYWHVKAQVHLPRKPDGLPLCGCCLRNLAIHTCVQCQVHYCLPCHRNTHSSPTEFFQNTLPSTSMSQAELQDYINKRNIFLYHNWIPTQPIQCQMCNGDKMHAGIYCSQCDKSFCRPCNRRLHLSDELKFHNLVLI